MSEEKSLVVDDYIMHLLERIREARFHFADYMEDLSGIHSETPDHGVPMSYQGAEYIEGQTVMSEVYDMIGSILFLEIELIRHLERLVTMRGVIPLRQMEWHLTLSSEDLDQIMAQAGDLKFFRATTPEELDFSELVEYFDDEEVNDEMTISFGYPPALLLEELYWPQRGTQDPHS